MFAYVCGSWVGGIGATHLRLVGPRMFARAPRFRATDPLPPRLPPPAVYGSGFSRGGQEGATVAYVGSSECTTVDYFSTDNMIVCLTPPGVVGCVARNGARGGGACAWARFAARCGV